MFPTQNVPGPSLRDDAPTRSKCEVPGTLYRLMGIYCLMGDIMCWESHSSTQHN
jgi:hypothetical protein